MACSPCAIASSERPARAERQRQITMCGCEIWIEFERALEFLHGLVSTPNGKRTKSQV